MHYLIEEIHTPHTPAQLSLKARALLQRLVEQHCGLMELPKIEVLPSGKPVFRPTVSSSHYPIVPMSRCPGVSKSHCLKNLKISKSHLSQNLNCLNLCFSLSHSQRAVMAVIDTKPVGCDIEDVTEGVDDALLAVTCTAAEARSIKASASPALEFTRIWTRKEAVVKRSGEIPDDPRQWPSDEPGLITEVSADGNFVWSISLTVGDTRINP